MDDIAAWFSLGLCLHGESRKLGVVTPVSFSSELIVENLLFEHVSNASLSLDTSSLLDIDDAYWCPDRLAFVDPERCDKALIRVRMESDSSGRGLVALFPALVPKESLRWFSSDMVGFCLDIEYV